MHDGERVIEIRNLLKRFGTLTAVDRVSLDIKRGEIFGLLGPNGAGKTTIINMLLGLLPPTSGNVVVEGIDMTKYPAMAKKRIGLVTQETVVESELTAEANLRLFGRLYQLSEAEIDGKIDPLLKFADLESFKHSLAGTFSGGMQRRLSLSKALIHDPSILVLDEPTTGLDIQNRTKMWELLRHINETRKVTVLMTTQYLEEADALCNRLGIIDHGRIIALGTPTQLKQSIGKGNVIEVSAEKNQLKGVAEALKSAFNVEPTTSGDRVSITVHGDPTKMLEKVLAILKSRHISTTGISMHAPTLDDVFLKLTGGSLRDTSSADVQSGMSKVLAQSRKGGGPIQ